MNKKTSRIVIVGGGTAGIMLANKLAKKGFQPTLIEPRSDHLYQPGLLFVPFGKYSINQLQKPVTKLLKENVDLIVDKVQSVLPDKSSLILDSGQKVGYDVLVIASGSRIDPSQTDGMQGQAWRQSIFDFYTPDGAEALAERLKNFRSGRLVVHVTDMPIKCPVAPLEFCFLADDYLKQKQCRDQVKITYVTSMSGAFTKPVASSKLSGMLEDRGIQLVSDFYVEKIDSASSKLICYDDRVVDYDLLVTVPLNVGASYLQGTDLVDDLGFVKVDQKSLQNPDHPAIFAIGDAAAVPTSKAGSVAHFEVDVVLDNILAYIKGRKLTAEFDGHSNCFVESGGGKALLLDFNYQVQPLTGRFPFWFGPMKLLEPSRINHWGKLAFRYIYWHLLLPGRRIPFIPSKMKLSGKKQEKGDKDES